MVPEHVLWGLQQLRLRRPGYVLHQDYYDGRHRLAFASERMSGTFGTLFRRFALNLCEPVVDAVRDRLHVVGFSRPGQESAADVEDLWERNLMPARHLAVHREALICGDAYVLVWQDPAGAVRMYDEDPREMVGHPDLVRPGELDFAVKAWCERKRIRVTVYYRDRIERYVTISETETLPDKPDGLRELTAADVGPDGDGRWEVPNPWGVVPVFHFAHDADRHGFGRSVLLNLRPIQDALNVSVANILVGGEFYALPLRYLIGVQPEDDPDTGKPAPMFDQSKSSVIALPMGAEAGQWDAGDVRALLETKREFAADMARVSGVPAHRLLQAGANGVGGEWPSGEALRTADAPLDAACGDIVTAWGPQWAAVNSLALMMQGRAGADGDIRTLWGPTSSPPSEQQLAETAIAKQRAGIPREQTWREMGYSEVQIAAMSDQFAAEQEAAAERQAAMFSAGNLDATGGL